MQVTFSAEGRATVSLASGRRHDKLKPLLDSLEAGILGAPSAKRPRR